MRKAIFVLIALLLLPAAFAQSTPTVVNGVVYSGTGITSSPVADVNVDVDCNLESHSDTTDAQGAYEVVFENCAMGDEVTACVGSTCDTKTVTSGITRFNLLEIKLFEIPEFSTVAASLGAAGAGLGYLFLRRRK